MKKKNLAIIYILISALGFALMSACVKLVGNDIPSIEKAFFRNLVALFVSIYFILKNKSSFFGKKSSRTRLALRGTLGSIGVVLNFYAIDHMVLADSSMLNKLSPFFVIIFSYLFLREKISNLQLTSLVVAFLGSLFIIKPSFSLEMIPYLSGFLSAAFAGGAYTCVRALRNEEDSSTIVFFFSATCTLITAPLMMIDFKPIDLRSLILLILSGIFACIAQYSLTIAYKYAPASEISIFDYTNIIFATIIGFILWGEIPDLFSYIGYALILGSSLFMFIYNNKKPIFRIK